MEDRQTVSVLLKSYRIDDFDSTLDDLIEMLTKARDDATRDGYFNAYLHTEQYYENVEIYLRACRYENDKEYFTRLDREKKLEERSKEDEKKRDEAELKLYEKLKKKYEGKQ